MILHSSGSTGLPKPIVQKSGIWRLVTSILDIKPSSSLEKRRFVHQELYGTRLIIAATPFFHCYGINLLTRSVYHAAPLVLLPGDRPATAELMLEAIEKTNPSGIACPPSILEDICAISPEEKGINILGKLEFVFYGGAPIATGCGEALSKVTRLINSTGTTEMWMACQLVPESRKDWRYFEWSDRAGIEMEETGTVGEDGAELFEMVVKRGEGLEHQFVFFNYPELDEWRSKDLFVRHATKPELWKSVGRIDDVLVLSNGEKINPVSFEKLLESHPWVKGAIVVGEGQFQTGLILEPQPDSEINSDEFINSVWPAVEKANAQYPAHGRVWRSMIMLAPKEKPFVRAPKGSVMRRATTQLYENEIKALYTKEEEEEEEEEDPAANSSNTDNFAPLNLVQTEKLIQQAVKSVLGTTPVMNDTSLFTLGMDSLQVLQLSQILSRRMHHRGTTTNKALRLSCSPRLIYDNPTISSLAQVLVSPFLAASSQPVVSREEKMSRLIHKHTRALFRSKGVPPTSRRHSLLLPSSNLTVILTGSTGSLGTHLLHRLLVSPAVSRIYCLNRAPDAASRQAALLSAVTPTKLPLSPKTTFHTVDLSKPAFGLSEEAYDELVNTANVFIHNAWPVNFNKGLEEFESAIQGVARIAEFARVAKRGTRVVFVSSVASATNWGSVRSAEDAESMEWEGHISDSGCSVGGDTEVAKGITVEDDVTLVPEEFDEDNCLPAKQGYGESKHVASCILARAARRWGLDVTLIRAGQLAGPKEGTGVWGRHGELLCKVPTIFCRYRAPRLTEKLTEWFPSLVATSKSLGKIPSSLDGRHGTVDWVPVDIAAQAVLELALSRPSHKQGEVACFNLVNPRPVPWSDLVSAVREFYVSSGRVMETVDMEDWVRHLQEVGASKEGSEDVEQYPALRLLDFFQGLANGEQGVQCSFGTGLSVKRSAAMAELAPVDGGLMKKWCEGWEF